MTGEIKQSHVLYLLLFLHKLYKIDQKLRKKQEDKCDAIENVLPLFDENVIR